MLVCACVCVQVYSVPPGRTDPALQEGNYDFPQPVKLQQEGIYDVPPPAPRSSPHSHYDFPPHAEAPPHRPHTNANEGIYDVPPPALHSGAGPQLDVYDVPRGVQQQRPPLADRDACEATDGVHRLSLSSSGSSRSSMSTSSSSSEGRLALDVEAAVHRSQRLQQALELSVGALRSMAASPHWRTFPFMERHANDVRALLDRVRAALGDLVGLGRGAAANAAALAEPGLQAKLRRQLGRLEDSQQMLLQSFQALEAGGWALGAPARGQHKSDELDRFVMVSRTLPDDAKQLASTVGGSAELLFQRSHLEGSSPEEDTGHPLTQKKKKKALASSGSDKDSMDSEKCVRSWMEDYDYVHLQVSGLSAPCLLPAGVRGHA